MSERASEIEREREREEFGRDREREREGGVWAADSRLERELIRKVADVNLICQANRL